MELAVELSMEDNHEKRALAPAHLWIVGGLTLVWGLYGAGRFVASQFGLFGGGQMVSAELAHFAAMPVWATAFWALTVWGSVAGSALLLARSEWAVQAFVVAVFGLIGTSVQNYVFAETTVSIYAMPIAFATWMITMASLLFAMKMQQVGVLR